MTLPKNVALPDFVWEEGLKNHPDKLALVNGATGRSYTYQEGHDSCKKFAIALMALGIEKGDVVALFMPNSPEFIVSLLGVAGIGAITTTINHNSTPYEVSQQLEASNTRVVVTTPFLTDIAENAIKKTSLAVRIILLDEDEDKDDATYLKYQKMINHVPKDVVEEFQFQSDTWNELVFDIISSNKTIS